MKHKGQRPPSGPGRKTRLRAAAAPLLLLLLLPCRPAAAQQPDSTGAGNAGPDTVLVTLPTVEVVASILTGAGSQVGAAVPARTSNLSGEALGAWEPRLLAEALASQPGISAYDDLGSPYKTTVTTRGFAAGPVVGLPQGVSVFIDGVPVNEPDAGQVNFDLLPLEHVSRVELLSGTASLLGPNSLGGAVNLVTRRGYGAPRGAVELSAGSHGAWSGVASLGGSRGRWSYYLGGGYDTERGWRDLTSATVYNALLNVGNLGPSSGIGLQALLAVSDAQTAGSLPLSVYAVRPDSNLSAGDFEDLSQVHLAVSGYARLGAGRGAFTAWLRGHGAERFNVNQVNDPDVRSFSDNRTLGVSADWRAARALGTGSLALRAGAGGSLNRVGIRIFAERIDPGLTTDVKSPIRDVGAYTTADYAVGRVTVSAGARYDWVRVPFRNRLNPVRDTTSTFVRLSPHAGVLVRVGRGASVYGSAGRGFRAPAVIELACADPHDPCPLPFALGDDPPLDPVVATTWEAGARWGSGRAAAGASLYRTTVRDEIFLFPYEEEGEPQGSTIDGYFSNIDRTRREGVELDARVLHPRGHALYLGYAFTRATFQVQGVELFSIREEAGGENEVEPGDRLPLVPDHTVRAGSSLVLPYGMRMGVDARYTGRQWLRGDEANAEEPLKGYLVTGLRMGLELRGWEIRGIVSNLFDAEYATFGTFNLNQGNGGALERFLTPGQPRTMRLVLSRSLGNERMRRD